MSEPTVTGVFGTLSTDDQDSKTFSWPTLHSKNGHCAMTNASWTLHSNGDASFDGTVQGDGDNDAWLMWLHLLDSNRAELEMLESGSISDDQYEFVKNLPDHNQAYDWSTTGSFDAGLFSRIAHMVMDHRC